MEQQRVMKHSATGYWSMRGKKAMVVSVAAKLVVYRPLEAFWWAK
jgi:hypothetical protein